MKVHVATKSLAAALASLERVVPSRSSNPGLTFVHVTLTEDRLTLSGTNMELDLEAQLTADAAGEGAWALPGHVLGQVVRALPADSVDLEFGDTEVRISSGSFDTKLQLADASQVPPLSFPNEYEGALPAAVLARLLTSVRYAAAANDYQAVFRGIRLEMHDGHTRAVGSDGFRLAYYHTPETSGLDADVILPARAVDELGRLLDSGEARISLGNGQMSIACPGYRMNMKLMEGTFPDYNRVIPRDFRVEMVAPAQALVEAVGRVSLLSDASANNRVDLLIEEGNLTITAEGAYGGAQETLPVRQSGPDEQISLAYNARYILDAVKPLDGDVAIRFSGTQTPSVVQGEAETGYMAMIGPLRTVAD